MDGSIQQVTCKRDESSSADERDRKGAMLFTKEDGNQSSSTEAETTRNFDELNMNRAEHCEEAAVKYSCSTPDEGSSMVEEGESFLGIPLKYRISIWPPEQKRRDNIVVSIAHQLMDPDLYKTHNGSNVMSSEEAEAVARRIEKEAFNIFGDVPGEFNSGLPVFQAYWSRIKRETSFAIMSTSAGVGVPPPDSEDTVVESKGKRADKQSQRVFRMDASGLPGMSNIDESEKNNEMAKERAEVFDEAATKSSSAPYRMSRTDFIPDGPTMLTLTGKDYRLASFFAEEAVREYNNRQFEDKLELLEVKKAFSIVVAGLRYDITFDAKIIAAEGEGKTQSYYASAWIKLDGTLEIICFELLDNGQGKEVSFWKES